MTCQAERSPGKRFTFTWWRLAYRIISHLAKWFVDEVIGAAELNAVSSPSPDAGLLASSPPSQSGYEMSKGWCEGASHPPFTLTFTLYILTLLPSYQCNLPLCFSSLFNIFISLFTISFLLPFCLHFFSIISSPYHPLSHPLPPPCSSPSTPFVSCHSPPSTAPLFTLPASSLCPSAASPPFSIFTLRIPL